MEPNQREATEHAAWRVANACRLVDSDSVPRLQLEIRAAIQSGMDHERDACAKIVALGHKEGWTHMQIIDEIRARGSNQ